MNRHTSVSVFIRVLNVGLGIGLAVAAGVVGWSVFFAGDSSLTPAPVEKQQTDVCLSRSPKAQGALRSLMHASSPESGASRTATADVSRLRLCGLAKGQNRAWAVLEDKESRTQIIASCGDRVFGYELKNVEENKVVLSKDGIDTELVIRAVSQRTTAPDNVSDGKDEKENTPLRKSGGNSWEVERAKIDLAFSDLAAIRKTARIIPFYRSGTACGFLVFDIKDESPLLEIGLKNGDIVTHINGSLLTSKVGPAELFSMLSSRDNVNLLVSRNSSTVNLCYRIR